MRWRYGTGADTPISPGFVLWIRLRRRHSGDGWICRTADMCQPISLADFWNRTHPVSGCTRCTYRTNGFSISIICQYLSVASHSSDGCVMLLYFRWINGWKAEWHSSRHLIHTRQNCSSVRVTSATDCECIDKWRAFNGINSSRTKPTGGAILSVNSFKL